MMTPINFHFFFSSRRRHTRQESVSWARRCVQETDSGEFKVTRNRIKPCESVGFNGFNQHTNSRPRKEADQAPQIGQGAILPHCRSSTLFRTIFIYYQSCCT
eukprot:TRINITY_DN3844_c0_g1_i13.p1 TRINITY_DN3844_c0_g1~~TRINITY_DN3844_c0_g1_i13.p1  ORF type:complete len:102 (+),score=18.06 TRINITY_DN3844_c0_g1_i13:39-344(+)